MKHGTILVSWIVKATTFNKKMPFYFAGTPTVLWTQKLLFLYAFLSVSTICRDVPIIMFSPSTTLHRPSSAVVGLPYSPPVESVFDWFTR